MSESSENEPSNERAAGGSAGAAYLVKPDEGPGPGVLVLHSWWGLTDGMKETANSLADAGYTALAPDLMAGALPQDPVEAVEALDELPADATAALIVSSIAALRAHSSDPNAPVSTVGYSMGASWALWVATRQPESVRAAVAYYGVTDVDFEDLEAPVLCHSALDDPLVGEDDIVEMQSHMLLLGKSVEVSPHEEARHFFAEEGVPMLDSQGETGARSGPEEIDAADAWAETLEFLARHQS